MTPVIGTKLEDPEQKSPLQLNKCASVTPRAPGPQAGYLGLMSNECALTPHFPLFCHSAQMSGG